MIGMTLFVLIFAEVTPILYAYQNPERVARRASWVVAAVSGLLYYPLMLPLTAAARGLAWLLGAREGERPMVTEDYLMLVIDESEEQGGVAPPDARMMRRVFELGDITVSRVMAPRPDIIAVDATAPLSEALELAVEHKHSRLPMYEDNIDNIVGILHTKDLLPHFTTNAMHKPCSHVKRPVHFVPENAKVSDVLRELQAARRILAVAVDEFGGTAGLITVEDVLEEVVGDILDETDVEEREVVPAGENAYRCQASVSLHALGNALGRALPEHVDTLGGLVFDLAGRVPSPGEVFTHENLLLTVQAVEGTRIEQVLVEVRPAEDEAEE